MEYPSDVYPPYCSGGGYIISQGILNILNKVFNKRIPFQFEDVYIGMLIHKYNSRIIPQDTEEIRIHNGPFIKREMCEFASIYLLHSVKPEEQQKLLAKTEMADRICDDNNRYF